ncbi:MAG: ABC transporter permease, partial [Pirellulaceae bacterium]
MTVQSVADPPAVPLLARLSKSFGALAARKPPWPAFIIVFALLVMALVPHLLAPHDPNLQSLRTRLRPPVWQAGGSWTFLLGTDSLGRDILSRIIYGTRVSLSVAGLALLVGGAVGTILGLVSGFFGRWTDVVLMRLADSMLAFPMILLAFLLAVTVGASFSTV